MEEYETVGTLIEIIGMTGWLGLTGGLFFLGYLLLKINRNIKELKEEVTWVVNRVKGIAETSKPLLVKKKRGRPPKQK